MPSLPQFFYGACFVGGIKVYRKLNIKHFSKPHCHITVTAEIKVDLKSVGQNDKKGRGSVQKGSLFKSVINRKSQNICQKYLFSKANGKKGKSLGKIFSLELPVLEILKLWHHFLVKNDRAGNKLWEKGNKRHIINKRVVFCFPGTSVNDKGKLLERKKADTKGKNNVLHGKSRSKQSIDVFKKEIIIFEIK